MPRGEIDPNGCPTALFCGLETALNRGDLQRAAELQRRLGELGFDVKWRPRRLLRERSERGKQPAATGGEGQP